MTKDVFQHEIIDIVVPSFIETFASKIPESVLHYCSIIKIMSDISKDGNSVVIFYYVKQFV